MTEKIILRKFKNLSIPEDGENADKKDFQKQAFQKCKTEKRNSVYQIKIPKRFRQFQEKLVLQKLPSYFSFKATKKI